MPVAVAVLLAASGFHEQPPSAPHLKTANWLEFDTDACGQLGSVDGKQSGRMTIHADDYDDDDDEWVNAWNMSPEESVLLNDWLAQRPDTATLTSAVEKSCDRNQAVPIDQSDQIDIA